MATFVQPMNSFQIRTTAMMKATNGPAMMNPLVSFCQSGIGRSSSIVSIPISGASTTAVVRLGGTVETGLRGGDVKEMVVRRRPARKAGSANARDTVPKRAAVTETAMTDLTAAQVHFRAVQSEWRLRSFTSSLRPFVKAVREVFYANRNRQVV